MTYNIERFINSNFSLESVFFSISTFEYRFYSMTPIIRENIVTYSISSFADNTLIIEDPFYIDDFILIYCHSGKREFITITISGILNSKD